MSRSILGKSLGNRNRFWSGWVSVFCIWVVASQARSDEPIDAQAFNILKRACFECHGRERQDGGLRLDSRDAIMKGGESGSVIDLVSHADSELIRRVSLARVDSDVMPKRGELLSARELKVIQAWLASGAGWSEAAERRQHWSYLPPSKNELPTHSSTSTETQHPIDAFVVDRLQKESLSPNPTADVRVLVRRLHLDVLGIPPTIAQVESFAVHANTKGLASAVEQTVDELLNSRQYGQKWAIPWLDAARYADSHGFQRDDLHELWAYRDWVINALNEDMPFDQFTIEQIAGDLLPNATQSQRIATGFNRCAPCNVEAGTDPDETRFNQIVDRVNTLGYVWLGTSLECAQCHDHKYDPISQKDYFGLFAFFNQTEIEAERSNPEAPASIRFRGPYMSLSEPIKDRERLAADEQIKTLKQKIEREEKASPGKPAVSKAMRALKPTKFESSEGASFEVLDDNSVLLQEEAPDKDTYEIQVDPISGDAKGLVIEALTHSSLPGRGPGRGDSKRPNFVLHELQIFAIDHNGQCSEKPIPLASAVADFEQKTFSAKGAIDGDLKTGWAISPQFGKDHWIAVEFADNDLLLTASALRITLVQNFGTARTLGRIRVSELVGDFQTSLPKKSSDTALVSELRTELARLEEKRKELEPDKTLVMQQVSQLRESTMFERGDFRKPSSVLEPATPSILPPLPDSETRDRLALAKWLVDRRNPLTARVYVNRVWAEIFGRGIVSTPEDFGLKGDLPTHPELLDWLACEWMEQGWSQKKLIKLIVTSETYRRSSASSERLQEIDAENKWLARGPRFRLTAELVRDNALSIAGLLSVKEMGPPIRPPQPEGLWKKVGGEAYDYQVSPGEDQFRRGVYVVLKRMSPYPSLVNFDATARLACRVKRGRSNTPLQALTLLNDPVYVEAARAFAQRIQTESSSQSPIEKIKVAFQIAVSRLPNDRELALLHSLYERELNQALDTQSKETDASAIDRAWYAVATTLLNLDETITKE